jgi:hypothetical protein
LTGVVVRVFWAAAKNGNEIIIADETISRAMENPGAHPRMAL